MSNHNDLICICMDVKRSEIEKAIKQHNCQDIDEIGDHTEAGTNCGACHHDLEYILKEIKKENS